MPFHLTSDQELVRKTVRELVEELKGKPAEHLDRERAFPKEELKKLAALGLTGMLVPPEQGGPGTDTVTFVLALEEVARASGVVALTLNNLNALGTFALAQGGEAVRAALPEALSGDAYVAWAMSEPNAGTDLGGVRTRARKDGGEYVLDGVKSFVVGAPDAKWIVVFARLAGADGLTAFLVPREAPGLLVAPPERMMSFRGSDMAQVYLKSVRVPEDHRIGDEGAGLALAAKCQDLAALGAAAIAVGVMQAAYEDAVAYSNDREQFRSPIKGFQAIQFLLADLEVELRAARLLTYAAADKRDRGEEMGNDLAAAKLFSSEVAKHLTQKSIRIHGGTGFMRDLPVERYNRDARALAIYAGTSEMQRAAIAQRSLGV